jgi:hypothetical protein
VAPSWLNLHSRAVQAGTDSGLLAFAL